MEWLWFYGVTAVLISAASSLWMGTWGLRDETPTAVLVSLVLGAFWPLVLAIALVGAPFYGIFKLGEWWNDKPRA